jgi:hypothetical protein
MFRTRTFIVLTVVGATPLGGCGTYVPQIYEVWESVDVLPSMETNIKERIYCETVRALKRIKNDAKINGIQIIPDSYGVQMQITLTVEETGAVNPNVTLNNTLPNAIANKVTVPQSFTFTGAATASSTATRVDTSYSYYNVGRITQPGGNTGCDADLPGLRGSGSSPLLNVDLGIEKFLRDVAPGALLFQSSPMAKGGAGKGAKLDVFSYEVKFIVVTNASISPTWKLVNISAGAGSLPLANAGRTRTHDLVLTFGPGTDTPADFALQTHFVGQIVQSNQQLRQTIVQGQ